MKLKDFTKHEDIKIALTKYYFHVVEPSIIFLFYRISSFDRNRLALLDFPLQAGPFWFALNITVKRKSR